MPYSVVLVHVNSEKSVIAHWLAEQQWKSVIALWLAEQQWKSVIALWLVEKQTINSEKV